MRHLHSPQYFHKVRALNSALNPQPPRRPTLLVISATYVADENQKKLEALAEHFDLTCATCTQVQGYGSVIALRDQPQPAGYRLVGLEAAGAPSSTTRYRLRGLRKVIRDSQADIILVESEPWALIRWQAWLWKKIHRPRALFGEFSWENIERPGFKGWLLRRCYGAASATDDFVIAGNQDAAGFFRRSGLPASRLLVSPQLGVDAEIFHPVADAERARLRDEMGIPPGTFCVGFCGRLVEEKGVLDLVQAVGIARERIPGSDIRLAILGHGKLGSELEKKAALAPWLRLLPPRAQSEVAPFFQALDLFVLPSKEIAGVWKEQFGHVLIQAMAAGVPTLGSDSGEIPTVIGDPAQIFLAGDPADLAQKIRTLLKEPSERSQLAFRQRDRILRKYTNRALAAQWAPFILGRLHDNKSQVDPLD
jgi:glycosyltransferase involved in cell wall biosynthesis